MQNLKNQMQQSCRKNLYMRQLLKENRNQLKQEKPTMHDRSSKVSETVRIFGLYIYYHLQQIHFDLLIIPAKPVFK